MKEIDRQVLGIVGAHSPLSESAIGMQMPGTHNELIAGCLRRLREKQHIDRSDAGLWSMKEAPPAPPPQQEIVVSETKKDVKTCPRCKETKPRERVPQQRLLRTLRPRQERGICRKT